MEIPRPGTEPKPHQWQCRIFNCEAHAWPWELQHLNSLNHPTVICGFIWVALKPHGQPQPFSGRGRTTFQGLREEQGGGQEGPRAYSPPWLLCHLTDWFCILSPSHSLRSPCLCFPHLSFLENLYFLPSCVSSLSPISRYEQLSWLTLSQAGM